MDHFYENVQGWFTYPALYRSMTEKYPSGSHFVEVGVWKGKSACYMAVEIVNSGKTIRFDCVDNWDLVEGQQDIDPEEYAGLYESFLASIEPVHHIITPVRMLSEEASQQYADGSLDFVFIDAAHDYENVRKDILAWLPKIKPGGTLAGHDYTYSENVKRAVDEIFGEVEVSEECWIKNL
jgi:predicted O-methyltransferase YrrM